MNREYYKTNYYQQSSKCGDYEKSILHNINYSAKTILFKILNILLKSNVSIS